MHYIEIAKLIERSRLRLGSEKPAQADLEKILIAKGIEHVREFRLNAEDIPDFMIGSCLDDAPRVAVELKIGGSARDIFRQVERYVMHDAVSAIVLATNRAMSLPPEINGKPAVVASLGRGWL
jgi:hypothetical protein